MRTLRLTLAYDGTDYSGWQKQSNTRSLQGVFERVLAQVTQEDIRVTASGRTDAGVHAAGQVVSFRSAWRLSLEVLQRALNAELPYDVAVLDAAWAPDGFRATDSALRKRYRYSIHDGPLRDVFRRRFVWQLYRRLDHEAMARAAQALVGQHDFSSFETTGSPRKSPIRTVFELTVRRGTGADDSLVTIDVEADGFLYNMVRTIVGVLVEVGRGYESESWPGEVLRATDRRRAARTAPPQGLTLLYVDYGDLTKIAPQIDP